MSDLIILYWILCPNLVFSFVLSLIVYIRSKKYYRPLIKRDKDNNPIDLHKKYDVFHPHDNIYFIQLWCGAFFFSFIKIISSLFIVIFVNWHIRILSKIYKNCDSNPPQRQKMKKAISFWSWLFLFMNGVIIKKKNTEYQDIYKKYIGEDYDFNYDKYSLIISNHIGFFEIVLCMALYSPSFMAKKAIANYYFIGPISCGLNCLFVDRENEKDKKKNFELLLGRQKAFYEKKIFAPLVLFPEGTCSCGRNILRFKKGAFYSLLPIKPQIVTVDQNTSFHLSVGATNVVLGYFKNLCHTFNVIYVIILPTVRPTDYMFKLYKSLGKEKWEIYANVVRKIYSDVGGLEETDMGLRDIKRYIKAMRTGFYDPLENMNFEKENIKDKNIKENANGQDNILEIKTENIQKDNVNFFEEKNIEEDKEKENIIDIKEKDKENGREIEESKNEKEELLDN